MMELAILLYLLGAIMAYDLITLSRGVRRLYDPKETGTGIGSHLDTLTTGMHIFISLTWPFYIIVRLLP